MLENSSVVENQLRITNGVIEKLILNENITTEIEHNSIPKISSENRQKIENILKIRDKLNSKANTKNISGQEKTNTLIANSPNGDYVASTAGKILRIWSAEGFLFQEYKNHPSTITAIHWNSNGTEIATASYGKIMIFLIGVNEPQKVIPYPTSIIALSWHLNGKWIVGGTQEGSICGWKFPNVEESPIDVQGYETKVTQLSWSKNGKNLATVGGSWIVIWDFSGKGPEGKKPELLKDDRKVTQMSYQNHGDLLASGTKDGSILFWRPAVPEKPRLVFEVDSAINHLRWSEDGSFLVICSEGGKVRIWNSPKV